MKRKLSEKVLERLLQNNASGEIILSQKTYKTLIENLGKHRINQWASENNIKIYVRG